MKKLVFLSLFVSFTSFAQSPPWESPLRICSSADGIHFTTSTVFQDSSGVASVIRIGSVSSDTLLSAFQWFPAPKSPGSASWDKVAVKFSYNGGASWTTPTTCTFIGLPSGYQRPFDPSLIKLPSGQIRMFYSTSAISGGLTSDVDTYSAISNNGITYTFEPTPKFNHPTKAAIDPSVAFFGSTYYYNSWTSIEADGANRAISSDGITFTTQAVAPYDGSHLWLGNYLADGSQLKFYGGGMSGMWVNSSSDGSTWGLYNPITVMGADPAVVKTKSGTYFMIYTGPPKTTDLKSNQFIPSDIEVFPSLFDDHIIVSKREKQFDYEISIYDVTGKIVYRSTLTKEFEVINVDLSFLDGGIYYCKLSNESKSVTKKIIKCN